METKIRFAPQTRDASELLTLLLSTLSQRLGTKVGLASLPLPGFARRIVTLGADEEPANTVLVRLFEQLSPSGRSVYSYRLLYDPGLKYYMMNISAVTPVRPRSPFLA